MLRLPRPQMAVTDWGDVGWGSDPVSSTWAGVSVSASTATQLMAVYGSVRLITDSISTLPVDVFRKAGDERQPVATPQWLIEPTPHLTFTEWCGQVLYSLLLRGNAYVVVQRNASAAIVALEVLDPDKVNVRRDGGRVIYRVGGEVSRQEIVHIKGLMLPGSDVGLDPIEYARQSIGLGLSALEYGSQFFTGEGKMPGVIEAPGALEPATLKRIADDWRRRRRQGERGLPGVLQGGAVWKSTGVTNEQAQFLATRQYTAAEIAGQMFLVDPTDLGIPVQGSSITYANLEQRSVRRVQVTLLPWIVRIEAALSELLARPRYMKFNVSGILRGDTLSRWQTYDIAERINSSAASRGSDPVLSTGEMRDFEEFGPVKEES